MKNTNREDFIEQATTAYRKHKKQFMYWLISVGVLSFFVVVLVGVSLRFYGQAKTNVERIYACTEEIHEHTNECGENCGYADYVVHTHNDDCFNEEGELICELEEISAHKHGSECYEEVKVLVCELEEGDEEAIEEIADEEESEDDEKEDDEELEEDEATEDEDSDEKNEDEESEDEKTVEEDSQSEDTSDSSDEDTSSDDNSSEDNSSDSNDDNSESNDDEQKNYKPPVKKQSEETKGHVHTDDCYEIRKDLVCGKYELHTHTDDCFNSLGDVICGKVELREHTHTKDCFVFEDQKKTRNAEVKYYASSDNFKVTVICTEDANIPEEAVLKVTEITQEDEPEEFEDKQEQIEEMEDVEATNLQYILDIGFYLEDEEIEPEDIVSVEIKFLDEEFIENNEDNTISIVHFEESGDAVLIQNTEIVDEVVNFETESFSYYAIATNIKYYGKYTVGYNPTRNAYLSSKYYRNGPLGVAGDFHIVAFNNAKYSCHVAGNFLAKNLYCGGNFQTNEASYIANDYVHNASNAGGQDALLALGYKYKDKIDPYDNNNHVQINYINNDNAFNILIDDNEYAQYIVLDDVKAYLNTVSDNLKKNKQTNVTVKDESQNLSVSLNNKNKTGVWNTSIDQLTKNVYFEDAGNYRNGIIVNVDCKNYSTIKLPEQMYSRAQTYSDAEHILWNFYNCNGSKIEMNGLFGTLIALGADVTNVKSVFNGAVFAENVEIKAESHSYYYKGQLTPGAVNRNLKVTLKAKKTVDGSNATADQQFEFDLYKYDVSESTWKKVTSTQNEAEKIKFEINYTSEDAGNTYYYAIVESQTKVVGYERDNKRYVYQVRINENSYSKELSSEVNRYQLKDGVSSCNSIKNNELDFNYYESTTPLTENAVIFDNKKEKVKFEVTKEWYDSSGNKLTDDMPDAITVQLMQTTDRYAAYYSDNVSEVANKIEWLTKDNGWKCTFDNLPKYDSEGRELYYFAKEKEVFKNGAQVMGGYEVSYSQEYGLNEGTLKITNKKISYESQEHFDLVVKKKWIDPEGNVTTDVPERKIDIILNQYNTKVVRKRITSPNVSEVNWNSDDLKFYVVAYNSGSSPHIGANVQCKEGDVIHIHLEFNILDGMSVTADEIRELGFKNKTDIKVENNKVILDSYIWVIANFSGTYNWDHCYYMYWKLDNENINGSISIQSNGTEKTYLSIKQQIVETTQRTEPIQYQVEVKASDNWTNTIFKELPLKRVQVNGDRVETVNYQYTIQELVPDGAGYYCESFDGDFGSWQQHMTASENNESEKFSQNSTVTINNQMTSTSFDVVKKWYDLNGNQVNAGAATDTKITVDVYQALTGVTSQDDKLVGSFNILKDSVATINLEDGFKNTKVTRKKLENYDGYQEWSLKLNNLPAKDSKGNKYYYYAVETKIGDHSVENSRYEVKYGENDNMTDTPVPNENGNTIINNYGVESFDFLPETGGKGTLIFRIKNWFINTFWSHGV